MEKNRHVRVWKKVITWIADDYMIDANIKDDDFIEKVIDGDIGSWTEENGITWTGQDFGEDDYMIDPGKTYEMSEDKPTLEIWEGENLLFDNRPEYIKRNEKLKKLLEDGENG